MDFEAVVLKSADADKILKFEKELLKSEIEDEMEREFASWDARWRPEALEHYLALGWSFAAWTREESPRLLGYFLAQPLLFFRGMTQTLWVEHMAYIDEEAGRYLVEVAYRMSRDKHLQKVLFANPEKLGPHLEPWKPKTLSDNIAEVKTSKVKESE